MLAGSKVTRKYDSPPSDQIDINKLFLIFFFYWGGGGGGLSVWYIVRQSIGFASRVGSTIHLHLGQ